MPLFLCWSSVCRTVPQGFLELVLWCRTTARTLNGLYMSVASVEYLHRLFPCEPNLLWGQSKMRCGPPETCSLLKAGSHWAATVRCKLTTQNCETMSTFSLAISLNSCYWEPLQIPSKTSCQQLPPSKILHLHFAYTKKQNMFSQRKFSLLPKSLEGVI